MLCAYLIFSACALLATSTGSKGQFGHRSGLNKRGSKDVGLKGFGTEDEEDPENQLKNENFVRNAE